MIKGTPQIIAYLW